MIYLSNLYQINLIELYLKINDINYNKYIKLKEEIISLIDKKDLYKLKKIVNKIQNTPLKYFDYNYDSFYGIYTEQLLLFAYGCILFLEKEYNKSNN